MNLQRVWQRFFSVIWRLLFLDFHNLDIWTREAQNTRAYKTAERYTNACKGWEQSLDSFPCCLLRMSANWVKLSNNVHPIRQTFDQERQSKDSHEWNKRWITDCSCTLQHQVQRHSIPLCSHQSSIAVKIRPSTSNRPAQSRLVKCSQRPRRQMKWMAGVGELGEEMLCLFQVADQIQCQ